LRVIERTQKKKILSEVINILTIFRRDSLCTDQFITIFRVKLRWSCCVCLFIRSYILSKCSYAARVTIVKLYHVTLLKMFQTISKAKAKKRNNCLENYSLLLNSNFDYMLELLFSYDLLSRFVVGLLLCKNNVLWEMKRISNQYKFLFQDLLSQWRHLDKAICNIDINVSLRRYFVILQEYDSPWNTLCFPGERS
jgi:hypothetical protein